MWRTGGELREKGSREPKRCRQGHSRGSGSSGSHPTGPTAGKSPAVSAETPERVSEPGKPKCVKLMSPKPGSATLPVQAQGFVFILVFQTTPPLLWSVLQPPAKPPHLEQQARSLSRILGHRLSHSHSHWG